MNTSKNVNDECFFSETTIFDVELRNRYLHLI